MASLRGQPAVDDELGSGGEGGLVAREKEDRGGDLLRPAERPSGAARARPSRIRSGFLELCDQPSGTIGVSANEGWTELTRIL